jgi:hypothetical protein
MTVRAVALATLFLFGCEGGGTPTESPVEIDIDRGVGGGDDATTDAVADTGGDGGMQDLGVAAIATCEAACEKLESCDQAPAQCLDACRAASRDDRGLWYQCLTQATCETIGACRLVAPPVSEGCTLVCADLEICGGQLAPPGCEARCAEAEEGFEACGDTLAEGECDFSAFVECLGREVYLECDAECDAVEACGLGNRATCLSACIAGGDDLPADPLARRRAEERLACRANAGNDCGALAACDRAGIAPPNRNDFCGLWSECGLDFEISCAEVYDFGIQAGGAGTGALWCAYDILLQGCPFDGAFLVLDTCFNVDSFFNYCADVCDVGQACGVFDAQAAAACELDCQLSWFQDPPDRQAYERSEVRAICLEAADCDEFAQCIDQRSPDTACDEYCAARAECDEALDAATCQRTCLAEFSFDRLAQRRQCVTEAPNCAAQARCEVPPPPPCAEYCDRAIECFGGADRAACLLDCDDAFFQNPAPVEEIVACVISAPSCFGNFGEHVVEFCFDDPSPGRVCHGFCRARTTCGDAPEALAECLEECAQGFGGDDALRFEVSADCLQQSDVFDCNAVTACVPESVEPDCDALCGRLDACNAGIDDCAARCAQDPLARLRSIRGEPCLAGADNCTEVLDCFGLSDTPVVEPVPNEASFCNRWNGCGFQVDFPCEEAYAILSQDGGPDVLRCAMDQLDPCPFDPFVTFDLCFGGGPVGDPQCEALCEARGFCGDAGGNECINTCIGFGDPEEAARLAPQRACGNAFSCVDLASCQAAASPASLCAEHCAARAACDPGLDVPACIAECDTGFARDRIEAWRACVGEAVDCAAVAACTPQPLPPCAEACERIEGCGRQDAASCVAECDDRAFADPLAEARFTACVLTARACDGNDSVSACLFGEPGGGLVCLNYCLAVDDCNPESERPLADCMLQCALGFGGAEGLVIGGSSACLAAQGEDPTCRGLRRCLVPALVDCAADCASLDACGVEVPDCIENCAAAPDIDRAGCVAEAARLGDGCAGVFACAGVEPPPVDADCARLCDERGRCEADLDPLLCALECRPGPAVPIRVACAEVSTCDRQPDCLALPAELAVPCADPCRTAAACGAFPDVASCQAVCTGRLRSRNAPPDFIADLRPCLEDAGAPGQCDVPTARACFDLASSNCNRYCEVIDECFGEDPQCVEFCQQDLESFPVEMSRQIDCYIRNLGNGVCDFDGAFNCANGF